jgi:hypothetical protein
MKEKGKIKQRKKQEAEMIKAEENPKIFMLAEMR